MVCSPRTSEVSEVEEHRFQEQPGYHRSPVHDMMQINRGRRWQPEGRDSFSTGHPTVAGILHLQHRRAYGSADTAPYLQSYLTRRLIVP